MYNHNVHNCINLNIPVPILLVSAFLLLLCLLVYIRDACELLFIKTLSELIEVHLTLNQCFMNEAVRCNDTECCSWYIQYKINGHFCIVLEYSTSYIRMLLICEWGN